jgi:hypothetical protein
MVPILLAVARGSMMPLPLAGNLLVFSPRGDVPRPLPGRSISCAVCIVFVRGIDRY